MQFRVLKSGTVLCLENRYDPAKKQGVQTQLAKFPNYVDRLERHHLKGGELTDEQFAEAQAWVAARTGERTERRARFLGSYAIGPMRELTEALTDESAERRGRVVDGLDAAELWKALDELTQALRKAGVARPDRPKKAGASAAEWADLNAEMMAEARGGAIVTPAPKGARALPAPKRTGSTSTTLPAVLEQAKRPRGRPRKGTTPAKRKTTWSPKDIEKA